MKSEQWEEVTSVATDDVTDVTDESVGAGLSKRLAIVKSFATKTRPSSSDE